MSGITDFHVHAFPDSLAQHAVRTLEGRHCLGHKAVLGGTIADLLRSMDEAGIERSVVCSIATAPRQFEPILNWSLGIRSPRIVPMASVHPGCEDMPGLVRRIAAAGLLGVKLHHLYQGAVLDDPSLEPLYAAVQDCGLMLVLHCGRDFAFPLDDDRAAPRRVLNIHRSFPRIPLVATHMGGWKMWDEAARTLAGADVYMETSYSLDMCPPDLLRLILKKHPPEFILFGTDSPWQDQKAMLELARATFRDARVLNLVLAENAQRLLGGIHPTACPP
jgi:predicted TIM-barrel fold metal-dependent hydrolase